MRLIPMLCVLSLCGLCSLPALSADGETIYKRLCTSCHGFDGEGRQGLGPVLAGAPGVNGDLKPLIDVIADGREDTLMVAFRHTMSKAELAAVITYVRRRFGEDPEALVTVGDIP